MWLFSSYVAFTTYVTSYGYFHLKVFKLLAKENMGTRELKFTLSTTLMEHISNQT